MLANRCRSLLDRVLRPVAICLSRLGVRPSTVTALALLLGFIVCLWFAVVKAVIPFCITILLVGALDNVDGALARLSGQVTKFGAYLDAVCDRYLEAMVSITVAFVTGYWILITLCLVGSLLVSYTKARAAMEVTVSNDEWPDMMERGERDILFIVGLALGELIPYRPLGHDIFWWVLLVLVFLIHLTVVQRIIRARRFILDRSSG